MVFVLCVSTVILIAAVGASTMAYLFRYMGVGSLLAGLSFIMVLFIIYIARKLSEPDRSWRKVFEVTSIGFLFWSWLEAEFEIHLRWKTYYKGAKHRISYAKFRGESIKQLDHMIFNPGDVLVMIEGDKEDESVIKR